MDFTIIGAGNMGRGIATRLLSGGNSVTIVDRDPSEAEKMAQDLRASAKEGAQVKAAQPGSPITSEAVVLAIYYGGVADVLRQYGSQLDGKIVVDITNPLNASFDDLATPPGSSAAEEIAKQVPAGAKVIKAFNTTFAGTLVAGEVGGEELDVFIAGDDARAKQRFIQALEGTGLRPIDAGPLKRARQLEGIGLLHIALQGTLGTNWASAVKILG